MSWHVHLIKVLIWDPASWTSNPIIPIQKGLKQMDIYLLSGIINWKKKHALRALPLKEGWSYAKCLSSKRRIFAGKGLKSVQLVLLTAQLGQQTIPVHFNGSYSPQCCTEDEENCCCLTFTSSEPTTYSQCGFGLVLATCFWHRYGINLA